MFEALWGAPLSPEPGLRIPNMLDAAVDGSFKAIYIQGEDILQSDPNTQHVAAGLAAMECVVVQDLFLNETANYAHVFLPGSTFLEKDGTFTNAERRIQRVRKVMTPRKGGYADWEITQLIANAIGLDWTYTPPEPDHGRDRAPDPDLRRRQLRQARRAGLGAVAVQRRQHPVGSPVMHIDGFARGKGKFVLTEYVPTDERTGPRYPAAADHRPHPHRSTTSAPRPGAPTTCVWHEEDRLEIHPHDAEQRGVKDGDWVRIASPRRRDRAARADHRSRGAGRGLHHLPPPADAGQRHHHRLSRTGRPTAPSTR